MIPQTTEALETEQNQNLEGTGKNLDLKMSEVPEKPELEIDIEMKLPDVDKREEGFDQYVVTPHSQE